MLLEKEANAIDKQELEYLKEGLKRTYKERFEMATRLCNQLIVAFRFRFIHF